MGKKIIGVVIFALATLQIFLNVFSALAQKNLIDFNVYRGALEKEALGLNPYSFLYSTSIPFNYPPSSLVVLSPFLLIPLYEAQIILTVLSLVCLLFVLWSIGHVLQAKISIAHFLIVTAFFIQTFPVKFTLILGQINLLILGLSFCALMFYIKAHHVLSTQKYKKITYTTLSILLLTFSAAVKIFPLYILPLFILKKDYTFPLFVTLLFIGLTLIMPFPLVQEYYLEIAPAFSHIGMPNYYDQSIVAFFMRLTHNAFVTKISAGFIISLLYLLIFYAYFKSRSKAISSQFLIISVSLVFAVFSIGNFFSWQHHLVFTYPLIFILYIQSFNAIGVKKILYKLFFLFLWGIFLFHFQNEKNPLLNNPFIASYQTITIFLLICVEIFIVHTRIRNNNDYEKN